jgi:alpha-tubulin suppressor-like RCC1 family protein
VVKTTVVGIAALVVLTAPAGAGVVTARPVSTGGRSVVQNHCVAGTKLGSPAVTVDLFATHRQHRVTLAVGQVLRVVTAKNTPRGVPAATQKALSRTLCVGRTSGTARRKTVLFVARYVGYTDVHARPRSAPDRTLPVDHLVVEVTNPVPSCKGPCVLAWGDGTEGTLGDGGVDYSPTPVKVKGLPAPTMVAAGDGSAYAVTTDGQVWAWGYGGGGALGDGNDDNSEVPVQVSGLSDAVAVAGGNANAYALTSHGQVWAWGYGGGGALGDGNDDNSNVPVQVSGLSDVIAIAGTNSGAYAVTADGHVWAWGGNVGSVPVEVPGLADVTQIAGTTGSVLALTADGTVWDLGVVYSIHGSPVQVTGLPAAVAIAAGDDDSYALTADGHVWSWGKGTALGNGYIGNNYVPPAVVARLSGVTAIAASFSTAVALNSNGRVWSWGFGSDDHGCRQSSPCSTVPVETAGLSHVTHIATDGSSTYALTTG